MRRLTTALLAVMAATGVSLAAAGSGYTTQLKGADFAPLAGAGATMPMAAGCQVGVADIVINDDGEAENGYGWNADTVDDGRYGEPFVADAYPATITTVCYSFMTNSGNTQFDFDIVVWASDGPGGTPGTELGRQTATGHPVPLAGLPATAGFEEFDISGMGLSIEAPVYIGLQWDPMSAGAGIFVAADESMSTDFNDGYSWANEGPWEPMGEPDNQENYRALMVRAVMPLGQPGPPSVGKSFTPTQVLAGEPSTVTLTLRNFSQPTAAELLSDFTDTLPAGLVISSPANAASTCDNATLDFSEGSNSMTLEAGAEIPAEASCEITFDVNSAVDDTYTNTIDAGELNTDHGANANPASATLIVGYTFPEPYCNREFSFSIEPITRVVFTDIDNPSSVSSSTGLEDFTSLVGTAALGQTVEMRVEGYTGGSYNNPITVYIDWNQDDAFDGPDESYTLGTLTDSTGTDGKQVIGDIEVPTHALPGETRMRVVKNFSSAGAACGSTSYGQAEDYTISVGGSAPPMVAKEFGTDEAMTNDLISVIITLTNHNADPMELTADFVDTLPAGLVASGATTSCVGSATFTANTLELATGAIIPANDSCVLEGVVAAAALGVYTNVIEPGDVVTDMGDNLAEATATVEVFDASNPFPPVVAASFVPSTIESGESSLGTVTLTNISEDPAVLSAPFTVVVPDGVDVSGGATTCGLVIGQNDPKPLAATNITLPAGMAIAANSSCEITFTAESDTPGSYVVTIAEGDLATDQGTNVVAASATLTVNAGFPAPYCERNFTSTVEPITRVVFNNIDNASSPVVGGSPALENFTSIIGSASQGQTIETRVEGNTNGSWTASISVYIDWNQDGTFDANEVYSLGSFANSNGTDGKNATGDILVPADALLGETRMRVVKVFGSTAGAACGNSDWGQAEDYTLVINDDPLPTPLASVTPSSLELEAEEGDSDSGILTVHNDGPGRLEFTVTRALAAAQGPALLGHSSYAKQLVNPANIDPVKQAILEQQRYAATTSVVEQGMALGIPSLLASDPECDITTPGIIVHDHDGTPDNGYGFNATAGNDVRLVDKFTPTAYPNSFDTVCIAFLSNTGLTSVPVDIVVFDDSGPGGGPGAELGSVSAVADNIAAGLGKQFQAFDISAMGLNIASDSVYIGVRWDATAQEGFFVASDQTSAQSAGGYAHASDGWEPAGDFWPDYRALFIRAVEGEPAPPGIGCDSHSNVPWLTVSPASGTIDGIGSTDVTVTADAAGLSVGIHEGWICVNTNDALNPRFDIPVTFEVTESGPTDIIFQDGFEGEPVNPDIVIGMINMPLVDDADGNTFDFVTGNWGVFDAGRIDDVNLYDFGDGMYSYWYGDVVSLSVGGVVDGANQFAVLQAGDTIGPGQTFSAAQASAEMVNWKVGVDGYLGIAFENEETGELNYGYIRLTTTAPDGYPARALEYGYNKAGDAITIP